MRNLAPLPKLLIEDAVKKALAEDLGRGGDITTNTTIPEGATASVVMAAREDGCIAGLDVAKAAFKAMDESLVVEYLAKDGDEVQAGDEIMKVTGNARAILTGERVALNFAGRLSGIATKTAQMVKATGNHKAKIASTRKTTPGLRMFEKYAVRVGGGVNHRLGLDDAVLIKDNHIAIAGGVGIAIERAKENIGHMVKIEVEVDTLEQLKEVMEFGVDVVLLDNMPPETLLEAVTIVDGRAVTEASGGVSLETVPAIAGSGVDMISVGALTHSAPCLDIGLDFKAA